MYKLLPVIIALLMVVSCRNKTADQGYHMPPKMMQQVLMDINLAEAFSTIVRDSAHKPGTKNYDSLAVFYASIFNHYKITPEQFNESLEWYKVNSDKLDTIYTKILANVTTIQNKTMPAVNPTHTLTPPPPSFIPPHTVRPGERVQQNLPVLPVKK